MPIHGLSQREAFFLFQSRLVKERLVRRRQWYARSQFFRIKLLSPPRTVLC